jgi:negative regulator of sigma-B (phosphoserine phosphatase)
VTLVEWGAASRPLRDGGSSGDMCVVQARGGGVLVAAIDALGHGPEAAATADAARAALESAEEVSLVRLVHLCHERLHNTRGIALSMAYFDAPKATMTWLGVGNVSGLLVRANAARTARASTLLLRTGIVGRALPRIAAETLPVAMGDRLIFTTDGIGSDFENDMSRNGPPQGQAEDILRRHYRGDDDGLVMVAVFRGTGS